MLLPKFGARMRPLNSSIAITKKPDQPAIANTKKRNKVAPRKTGPQRLCRNGRSGVGGTKRGAGTGAGLADWKKQKRQVGAESTAISKDGGQSGCSSARGLVLVKHDRERTRQHLQVVDHANPDKRAQLAKRGAYLSGALGLAGEAPPAGPARSRASTHDDTERKLAQVLVSAHVAAERGESFNFQRIARPLRVDAGRQLTGLAQ